MTDVSSGVSVDVDDVWALARECRSAAGQVEEACRAVGVASLSSLAPLSSLGSLFVAGARLEFDVGLACAAGMGAAYRLGTLGLAVGAAAAAYETVETATERAFADIDRGVAEVCGVLARTYGDQPGPALVSPPVSLGTRSGLDGVADLVGLVEGVVADDGNAPPGRVDVWAVGQPPSYVVALPGTSSWTLPWATTSGSPGTSGSLRSTGSPGSGVTDGSEATGVRSGTTDGNEATGVRSLRADLDLLAGASTAELAALPAALAAAGVPAGARVILVGHSQGGLTALRAAGDERLTSRYRVTHVVTAGAPVAGITVPAGVRVLSLERRGDVVPLLDGHANRADPDRITVRFSAAGSESVTAMHSIDGYVQGAREVDELAARSADDPDLAAWEESLTAQGVIGGGGSAVGMRVLLTLQGGDP